MFKYLLLDADINFLSHHVLNIENFKYIPLAL